ncbi:hypothetical protein BJY01DRAFT_50456 [Aspergillus pseudoustus]|uniref:EGF-like domain-containing protein n=1 Tax=Aspergillus pseudoustus TaxID=1810923 RepID=A0ABR4KQ45_9EURO
MNMDAGFSGSHGRPDPRLTERKGSVRRAREMLEAGRRPRVRVPQANIAAPSSGPRPPKANGWPLSSDNSPQPRMVDPHGRLSNILDSQGRLLGPGGVPPPQHPSRQDLPSPSVYSERSVSDAVPSPLHVYHPGSSFSQPFPNQQHIHPALRESAPATNEDMFRKSAAESVGSIPSIPDFPPPLPPSKSLAPPPMRSIMNRRSSVSPIPEELPDSPTIMNKPYQHSRVTASSWNSEQRESDILGAYLDSDSSDDAQQPTGTTEHAEVTLVRQASLGKRGKPSLRTISKPSVGPTQIAGSNNETSPASEPIAGASLKEIAAGLHTRASFDSSSSDESHIDPEKPPIMLCEDRGADRSNDHTRPSIDGTLPQRTPTMSETRPGARRPPRLNMNAVREAEARGSLTSLSDLIKRATKLATNLEHGRTASRNDLLNAGAGSRFPFHGDQNRKSGSIKDILASFPNPAATPDGRSSWPIFWRRSTLHQLNSQDRGHEAIQGEKGSVQRRRRCCGMPLWVFIVVCVILLLVVAAAVLIPIFLVVVPRENKSNDGSSTTCARTSPCSNGGVSVSSGDVCSCVCVNGYTGSRCTNAGDASCVTTEITQGSTSRNATVGDDLPRLFQDSQSNFSISLDPVTIMALFSQNNVSCTTENALVSFDGLSSNNNRRSLPHPSALFGDEKPLVSAFSHVPTGTVIAPRSVATINGILVESTPAPTREGSEEAGEAESAPTTTATAQPTSTPAANTDVVDFSRVAVLYILQKTGELNAAMFSAESIEKHLEHSSNSTSGHLLVNLTPSGVMGNFTLDFDDFTITDYDGETVGDA